ncbi:hypothetical protein [Nocardia sp. NPDC049526]|uniref:hypothetical protein n=1 Tax=Nocardia sp. NPDC049526 TaxID=3364316 RepID=UPI0037A788F8
MTQQLPPWPGTPPTCGPIILRKYTEADTHLAIEMGADPYIPLIGSLPAFPTATEALDWVDRQHAGTPMESVSPSP